MKSSTLVIVLLLSTTLVLPSMGKKLSKKDKKTLKLFKSLTKKAESLQTSLVSLVSRLEAANQTANGQRSVSTRWGNNGFPQNKIQFDQTFPIFSHKFPYQ